MLTKSQLREAAREKRKALAHAGFPVALAAHTGALNLAPGTIVGGYHASPGEADPARLLAALAARGCRLVFPRVTGRNLPLAFHGIPEGDVLRPGAFGIAEPLAHWPTVRPHLLLVPLLAFDARGHRIGYGGGFYDRTLARMPVRAIGIAYAEQEISSIPAGAHDRTLDGVLTEQGLRIFR